MQDMKCGGNFYCTLNEVLEASRNSIIKFEVIKLDSRYSSLRQSQIILSCTIVMYDRWKTDTSRVKSK